MERMFREVEQRAFSRFQQRGESPGGELDDWLNAERELLSAPLSEMTEGNKEYTLRIAAPGLEPGNIHVTATPETIVVQGKTTHHHKEADGEVRFCEFKEKLFRRIDFPSRIDPDKVSATVDKGILHIVAAKAAAEEKRNVTVRSATQ
jgi:HSP20 family protein